MQISARDRQLISYALGFLSCNLDDGEVGALTGVNSDPEVRAEQGEIDEAYEKLAEEINILACRVRNEPISPGV